MFPTPSEDGKFSPSWLYSGLADLYQKWLPGEEQQTTLRQAGYFSVSTDMSKKSRRMGCGIPRCKLQCGITQPITLKLSVHHFLFHTRPVLASLSLPHSPDASLLDSEKFLCIVFPHPVS